MKKKDWMNLILLCLNYAHEWNFVILNNSKNVNIQLEWIDGQYGIVMQIEDKSDVMISD